MAFAAEHRDPYHSFPQSPDYPGTKSRIVVPSDTVDLDPHAKCIMALATGNVAYIPSANDDGAPGLVSAVGVPAGWTSPHRVRRVLATGTNVGIVTVDG